MSDQGRKDFSTKINESVKPDSEKSYMEKGKEYVTDKTDQAVGNMQPNRDKGVTQNIADSAGQGKREGQREQQRESMGETAQEYMDAAKSKLADAVEYVSSSVHGGNNNNSTTK